MQQFDITVPANKPFVVNAPGRFIKYVAGSNGGGDATLLVTPGLAGGQVLALVPGQAYRVAANQPVPSSWTVANKAGGAAIIGQVVVGDGDFMDATVAGIVSVIDAGVARALGNQAFIGQTYVGPVAAQYSKAQIWNPVGSGKTIYIEGVAIGLGAAGSVGMIASAVAIGANTGTISPKVLGGVAGVAVINSLTEAAAPAQGFGNAYGQAQTTFQYPYREPIVLKPGNGLIVPCQNVNTAITAMFEWYEQ
ncbi:hypothetical protein [Pandoraea sp. 64-18]|uniref:hypothetical protein n=1 Tax=Pandoraea sp. 64-18 TaxID=1895806 RepID=UPI000964B8D4|nr:hypothetical protein [Pandoraea sp. 64-18]OJY20754.1 MAG: hypothetical protein BGP02_09880 [Pandoraea sp. 64-18]